MAARVPRQFRHLLSEHRPERDQLGKRGELLSRIFPPKDSTVPTDDIFGRAQALPRKTKNSGQRSTRPVRFQKQNMSVIMSLAGMWAANNRNVFFVEVLTAYRNHQFGDPA